jgi:hypothetical protein
VENLEELTAICGIDCFNCDFFHTNIDSFFESMSEVQQKAFESRGMSKEKVSCKGCRITGCTAITGKCETKVCAEQKGIKFCFECHDFPCVKLQPLAEGAERFPHNLKVYNLMAIKTRGIQAWAKETLDIRKRYFKGKFKIGAGPQPD